MESGQCSMGVGMKVILRLPRSRVLPSLTAMVGQLWWNVFARYSKG